jgi:hypothetical protein
MGSEKVSTQASQVNAERQNLKSRLESIATKHQEHYNKLMGFLK